MFSLAMMTNLNEVEKPSHINMQFVEFLEALARVADKFKLEQLEDTYPDHEPRNPFKLDKKLEIIILKLIKAILPEKQANGFLTEYKDKKDKELAAGGRM